MPSQQLDPDKYDSPDFKFSYTVERVEQALDKWLKNKRKELTEHEITVTASIQEIIRCAKDQEKVYVNLCANQAMLIKLWAKPIKTRKGKGQTSKVNIVSNKR